MTLTELTERRHKQVQDNYLVSYQDLPHGFLHKSLLWGLGQERTNSSCGQSVAMVGLRANGEHVYPRSQTLIERLNWAIPTKHQGIDPYPLARGVKKLGVESIEYRQASVELLIQLLTAEACFCALLIQAPWAKYSEVTDLKAGHNVVAGYYDGRSRKISGFEPGNGRRFFQMAVEDLDKYYWIDRAIRSPKITFDHWMLWMPVN